MSSGKVQIGKDTYKLISENKKVVIASFLYGKKLKNSRNPAFTDVGKIKDYVRTASDDEVGKLLNLMAGQNMGIYEAPNSSGLSLYVSELQTIDVSSDLADIAKHKSMGPPAAQASQKEEDKPVTSAAEKFTEEEERPVYIPSAFQNVDVEKKGGKGKRKDKPAKTQEEKEETRALIPPTRQSEGEVEDDSEFRSIKVPKGTTQPPAANTGTKQPPAAKTGHQDPTVGTQQGTGQEDGAPEVDVSPDVVNLPFYSPYSIPGLQKVQATFSIPKMSFGLPRIGNVDVHSFRIDSSDLIKYKKKHM